MPNFFILALLFLSPIPYMQASSLPPKKAAPLTTAPSLLAQMNINTSPEAKNEALLNVLIEEIKKKILTKSSLEKLMRAGVDINAGSGLYHNTPLILASNLGDLDVVKLLLSKGADINRRNVFEQTSLMGAASQNQISVVRYLLGAGAAVDLRARDGETALMIAARKDYIDVVKALLDAGADVTVRDIGDRTAQILAQHLGYEVIVSLLAPIAKKQLEEHKEIEPSQPIERMLLDAQRGRLTNEKMEQYIKGGLSVNSQNANGETVFFRAAAAGRLATLKMLIQNYHADPVQADSHGNTPLMIATFQDYPEVVRYLVGYSEINHRNKFGESAVMNAIDAGDISIIEFLLSQGADVNRDVAGGLLPLAFAIQHQHGQPKIIELLLKYTDLLRPGIGISVLDAAKKYGAPEIIEMVLNAINTQRAKSGALDEIKEIKRRLGKEEEMFAHVRDLLSVQDQIQRAVRDSAGSDQALEILRIQQQLFDIKRKEFIRDRIHTEPNPANLKTTAKIVRRNIADLEALNMPELAEPIERLKRTEELYREILSAKEKPTELTPEQKKEAEQADRNAKAPALIADIQKSITDNNLEAAQKHLAAAKNLAVTDAALQRQIAILDAQYKKMQSEVLQKKLVTAFAAYNERRKPALLEQVKQIIGELEALKLPELKELIRSSNLQLRATEKEKASEPGRTSPPEEAARISPVVEIQSYMIFDPYGEVANVPKAIKPAIERALNDLSVNFKNSAAEKLAYAANVWRIRVGDYRIIYTIMPDVLAIGIVTVDQRASVYEDEPMVISRDEDFVKLNTYSPEELISDAEKLLKSDRPADANRAAALLELYRWLMRELPSQGAGRSEYLKSLLLSATAQLKMNDLAQARELFTNLIPQAADYSAFQQQARVGLAKVEQSAGNHDAAKSILEQALKASRSTKERKDIQDRIDRLKAPSPTQDPQIVKLQRKLSAAQRLMATEPDRAEIELEGFLKESSSYEALAHEREEANKLLNQIGHQRNCEERYATAVDAFEAGQIADAVNQFKAYLGICAPYITRERRREVEDYFDQAALSQSITAVRAREQLKK